MSVADIYVAPRRSLVKLFCVIDLKKWISQDRKIGKKKKLRISYIYVLCAGNILVFSGSHDEATSRCGLWWRVSGNLYSLLYAIYYRRHCGDAVRHQTGTTGSQQVW